MALRLLYRKRPFLDTIIANRFAFFSHLSFQKRPRRIRRADVRTHRFWPGGLTKLCVKIPVSGAMASCVNASIKRALFCQFPSFCLLAAPLPRESVTTHSKARHAQNSKPQEKAAACGHGQTREPFQYRKKRSPFWAKLNWRKTRRPERSRPLSADGKFLRTLPFSHSKTPPAPLNASVAAPASRRPAGSG